MGGERSRIAKEFLEVIGSSPRGRGTRSAESVAVVSIRFIPAWAGNAHSVGQLASVGAVHPRVGGERNRVQSGPRCCSGSSPRGRGTHRNGANQTGNVRFIPAWAGNASSAQPVACARAVHPRVGGERYSQGYEERPPTGSSPRGRGTLSAEGGCLPLHRFIPAWAGNARRRRSIGCRASVHPRVGGERGVMNSSTRAWIGSSPRGRGTPAPAHRMVQPIRFIPAWAGNAGVPGSKVESRRFIPAWRGTLRRWNRRCLSGRFIPAWAGNAVCTPKSNILNPVHPRVGGERLGSRFQNKGNIRFIPAWAGNASRQSGRVRRPSVHPRVGGERTIPGHLFRPDLRFIPAWAGNAATDRRNASRASVHPRVGGERSCRKVLKNRAFHNVKGRTGVFAMFY